MPLLAPPCRCRQVEKRAGRNFACGSITRTARSRFCIWLRQMRTAAQRFAFGASMGPCPIL